MVYTLECQLDDVVTSQSDKGGKIFLLSRFRHECVLLGRWTFLTPILVMLGFAFFISLLLSIHRGDVVRVLTSSLEMFLPLSVGMVISTIATQDVALELQLTLPKPYSFTVFYRIAIVVLWTALVACISTLVIMTLHLWPEITQLKAYSLLAYLLATQLVWIAPTLWFSALSLFLSLSLRSSIVSGTLVGTIWLIEVLAHDLFASTSWLRPVFFMATTYAPTAAFWMSNRFDLITTAVVLLLLSWQLLHYTEARFQSAKGEE